MADDAKIDSQAI